MAEHKSLSEALAAAQAEYPAIEKTSVNPHFKSSYADLADGMDPIRPILARHGIAYTQTFSVVDGTLLLRTKLRWQGEEEVSDLPIAQPPKPQDFVALTTYYRRVALFSIAGITPCNEDDDGNTANEVAPARQTRQPTAAKPKLDVVGKSPGEAVDAALAAQDRDPWKLEGIPAENVATVMIAAIGNPERPWHEITKALAVYRDRVTLTDHERKLVNEARELRRKAEHETNILAAG
jgi:hypothetical protein